MDIVFKDFDSIFFVLHISQVSGEFPSATPDNQSVRSTSGPLGPGDRHLHSLPYIDPRQPGNPNFELI